MLSVNQFLLDGLVQVRRNSIAIAVELHLSCTNPSICFSLERNDSHFEDNSHKSHFIWDIQIQPIFSRYTFSTEMYFIVVIFALNNVIAINRQQAII